MQEIRAGVQFGGDTVPSISAIVVNHNRAALLRDSLDSLLRQTLSPSEIIVVDNASTDTSVEMVSALQDARIRLLRLSRNLGFSGGCNAGFREARGELLALLNNDAVADPGWLAALVAGLDEDPSVGMCASRILFFGTNVIDKAGHLIYWDGQNRGRGTGAVDSSEFDRQEPCLFPDGCAALYRRELVEEVGGFDEDFFAYADDADLGLRARLLGWEAIYCPGAVVYHRHSSTTSRFSGQKIYWVERNRLWLAAKSFPLWLLLLNPLLTLYRWLWNLMALLARRGPAGNYRGESNGRSLVGIALKAYFDSLRGLPMVLRKRRAIRRGRRISDWDLVRLLWRHRISARSLALHDF